MRISDWSSNVCSSDLADGDVRQQTQRHVRAVRGSDTAGHQRFQRITISARVTQVDGKALASIDDGTDFLTADRARDQTLDVRSEEHTSELQSLMRISYAVFCLKKKKYNTK